MIVSEIGAQLRAARMARGLSVRAVASAVGVSASLVSQVETGKTSPSVSTLYALVNYLGVSHDDLMAKRTEATPPSSAPPEPHPVPRPVGSGTRHSFYQRSSENPVIEMEKGVRWERLSALAGGNVDPMLVIYEPGASSSIEGRMMRHSGVEHAYIMSGELTVRLEFEEVVLGPGDSLSFDSVRPHTYINRGSIPARGLWFVVGRREYTDEVPPAFGSDTRAQVPQINSAVDVLHAMDRLR